MTIPNSRYPLSNAATGAIDKTRDALDALNLEEAEVYNFNLDNDESDDVEPVDELDLQVEAYIDGEMSEQELADFEKRLKIDAGLQRRVELEKKAFDALDALEEAPKNVDLTEQTVERLNTEAKAQLEKLHAKRATRIRRGRAIQILAPVVCLFLGYCAFSAFSPDVCLQRERDAEVVERLVQLEAVGDFEYLQALANANLFEEWRKTPAANSPNAKRAENVVSAEVRERPYSELVKDSVFYRLQRRFEALDRDSQKHWRNLRRQIDASPDRDKLLQTLDDYAGWLFVSTSASDRARLQTLPVATRIQEIRRRLDASQRFADRSRNRQNDQRPGNQERNTGANAQNTGPVSALRATLPPSLRRENFQSIYNKYVEYCSKNNTGPEDSQDRHDNVLKFLSDVKTDDLVSDFSQESKDELDALDPQQRSSMMGLIVSLSFVENAERFMPTRPFQRNEEQQRNPFKRRGNSVQELAETLRDASDKERDFITSRPSYEARGLLLALNWGFFNPQNERNDNERESRNDMRVGPANGPGAMMNNRPGAPMGWPMNNGPGAPTMNNGLGAPAGGPMNNGSGVFRPGMSFGGQNGPRPNDNSPKND